MLELESTKTEKLDLKLTIISKAESYLSQSYLQLLSTSFDFVYLQQKFKTATEDLIKELHGLLIASRAIPLPAFTFYDTLKHLLILPKSIFHPYFPCVVQLQIENLATLTQDLSMSKTYGIKVIMETGFDKVGANAEYKRKFEETAKYAVVMYELREMKENGKKVWEHMETMKIVKPQRTYKSSSLLQFPSAGVLLPLSMIK